MPAPLAIALDFDGVCKLFTERKHQIMSTLLFLWLREFQRPPLEEYMRAYGHINFRSQDYAGKARFLCVDALAAHLAERGFPCALPEVAAAVRTLEARGAKVNAATMREFAAAPQVAALLGWSEEVDRRLAELTELGLTPGIAENLFAPFRDKADFYVVSTATELSVRASLEREGVDFIRRYYCQETASKTEALTLLTRCEHRDVFMFGDSVEDSRAAAAAGAVPGRTAELWFVPVIPGDEARCFALGREVVELVLAGRPGDALERLRPLAAEFEGKEAGGFWRHV